MGDFPLKKDCFVTSVTLLALRKFGEDALNWDPLVVKEQMECHFGIDRLPQRIFDKLNCGLALVGTNTYVSTIEGFLSCTACMNDLVLDGSIAPFVTFEQCAWGIWEYINLNGDIDAEGRPTEAFSPDIVEYLREAGRLNGISEMPNWMKFAQADGMPDMTGDVTLFEQYMQRQQEYVEALNAYVNERQAKLTAELEMLAGKGLVGGDAEKKSAKTPKKA